MLHHLLRLLLSIVTEQSIALGNDSLLLSLTGSLGLSTLGVHLLLKTSLTGLLSLGTVDLIMCKNRANLNRIVINNLRAQPMLFCA